MNAKAKVCVAIVAISVLQVPAVTINTIAYSGQAAPGVPGGEFANIGDVCINESGKVAFDSYLEDGVGGVVITNRAGLWSDRSGSLELMARAGDPAPGLSGSYLWPDNPNLADNDDILFESNGGFWFLRGSTPEKIAVYGDPAPGTDKTFSIMFSEACINAGGFVAFEAESEGTTSFPRRKDGIWTKSPGSALSCMLLRRRDTAPGTSGSLFESFSEEIALNDSGEIVFEARAQDGTQGYWVIGGGTSRKVIFEGEVLPGTGGGTFAFDYDFGPGINEYGHVVFKERCIHPDGNKDGIWTDSSGSLQTVALEGGTLPGAPTGTVVDAVWNPVINAQGSVLFWARMDDGFTGLWLYTPTGTQLLVARDDAAPGIDGAQLRTFHPYCMNRTGQIVIRASWSIGAGEYMDGLWLADSNGVSQLLIREGQSIEIESGVFKTVEWNTLYGGNTEDGHSVSISDSGMVGCVLQFTDDSEAVVTIDPFDSPTPDPDGDADGIPDDWEIQYFGSTNVSSSAICSNGLNTLLECYIAGLNPTNAQEEFKVAYSNAANEYILNWNCVSDRLYRVYWTPSLTNAFQCVESNISWDCITYTNQFTNSTGFFKIGVELDE